MSDLTELIPKRDELLNYLSHEKEKDKPISTLITKYLTNEDNQQDLIITSVDSPSKIYVENNKARKIINLKRFNDIGDINYFLKGVNNKLAYEGTFICCVETYNTRKQRIFKNVPKIFFPLVYGFDFLINRVAPKLPVLKDIYFKFSKGKNKVLSKAESLGRLYASGFKVVDLETLGNLHYIRAKKVNVPDKNENASYGPVFKMSRVGKNGKMIKVYKLRTMHAYSEYLQEFIYENYNLQQNGKFKNDFRIPQWGKIFRKLWIDELPMLINLVKGDMKLVGVRPLSKHYYSLYPENLKELRTKTKPGLVPPFYADMPETFEEILASERKYLRDYFKSPLKADIYYFLTAMKNILIKKARSC